MTPARSLALGAFATSLAAATPLPAAAAQVLTNGSYQAGTPFSLDFTPATLLGPGTWRFRLDSTTPLDLLVGNIIVFETVTECLDGSPCEVNTYETVFYDVSGSTPLLATLTVDTARTDIFPDASFTYEQSCCRFDIFQSGTAPGEDGTYTLSAMAIPEPGTWALLLAGFFVTGAALRGHRQGVVAHS